MAVKYPEFNELKFHHILAEVKVVLKMYQLL